MTSTALALPHSKFLGFALQSRSFYTFLSHCHEDFTVAGLASVACRDVALTFCQVYFFPSKPECFSPSHGYAIGLADVP